MFRNTGFMSFILSNRSYLRKDDMEVCCAIMELISMNTNQEKSAGSIRKLVAEKTQKIYLNNQNQQDAEEFLRFLIEVIISELTNMDGFELVKKKHWGIERVSKIFLDNLPTGSCYRCNELPSCRNEDFLFLKLIVPSTSNKVNLLTLIQSHCSVSDPLWMKCSNCCPHAKIKVDCPQTGFCSRQAANKNELLELPEYLLVTLLRFGDALQENKIDTVVEFKDQVIFSSGDVYTPISNIAHIGQSLHGGHYVNYSKDSLGQWWLFDDCQSKKVTFEDVTKSSSYIILLKKKEASVLREANTARGDKEKTINEENVPGCSTSKSNQARMEEDFIVSNFSKKRKMSDEELSSKIQALELKKDKLPDEIVELKRLKDNRRKRKSRSQLSDEKLELQKCQDREYKRVQRSKETPKESDARKGSHKLYMKEHRQNEDPECYENRKENDRKGKQTKRQEETVQQAEKRKCYDKDSKKKKAK